MFNPLNTELNRICHLLALLGARHFFHVSRIRVTLMEERRPKLFENRFSWRIVGPNRDEIEGHF